MRQLRHLGVGCALLHIYCRTNATTEHVAGTVVHKNANELRRQQKIGAGQSADSWLRLAQCMKRVALHTSAQSAALRPVLNCLMVPVHVS